MSYVYAYDGDASLAICRYAETTTGADLAQSCVDLYDDPRWRAGMNVVVDLTAVSRLIIDPEEMRLFVEAVATSRARARPGRVYYVVSRDDHYFAARACAVQMQRRGWETLVVPSMGQVLHELGLATLPPALRPDERVVSGDPERGRPTGGQGP